MKKVTSKKTAKAVKETGMSDEQVFHMACTVMAEARNNLNTLVSISAYSGPGGSLVITSDETKKLISDSINLNVLVIQTITPAFISMAKPIGG